MWTKTFSFLKIFLTMGNFWQTNKITREDFFVHKKCRPNMGHWAVDLVQTKRHPLSNSFSRSGRRGVIVIGQRNTFSPIGQKNLSQTPAHESDRLVFVLTKLCTLYLHFATSRRAIEHKFFSLTCFRAAYTAFPLYFLLCFLT